MTKQSDHVQAHTFFSLKTQFENIGDALINRELVRLVAKHNHVHIDLSRCPQSFVNTLGLDQHILDKDMTQYSSCLRLFWHMGLRRLQGQRCYYFLSPGGYVGEIKGRVWIAKYVSAIILLCFYAIGIRICHVGVSYERLGPRFTRLLKWRSALLYTHLLRDHHSLKYAQSLGLKCDGLLPDLAFHIFTRFPNARIQSAPHQKVTYQSAPNRVCFSFRTDQSPEQFDHVKAFVEACVKTFPETTKYMCFAQVERDAADMSKLRSHIETWTGHQCAFQSCTDRIETCLSFYQQCDVVISNRLHALLMGGSQTGHILACITGQKNQKIQGLLSDVGLQSHILDLDKPLSQQSWQQIYEVCHTPIDLKLQKEKLKQGFQNLFQSVTSEKECPSHNNLQSSPQSNTQSSRFFRSLFQSITGRIQLLKR